jgi:hypothetical protein
LERVNWNLQVTEDFSSVGARWDEDIHMLVFAFKTEGHESIQINPAKLFLGRELCTPLEGE